MGGLSTTAFPRATLADVVLRPVRDDDRERVRAWRNAPAVRRHMYTDHQIGADEHARWWDAAVRDPRLDLLIAEWRGQPMGFVSISAIDARHGTCFWAFYIGPDERPKGLGSVMEVLALDRMTNHHGLRKIGCEVLASNDAVVRMHQGFGFQVEGTFRDQIEKDGQHIDVIRLALFTADWQRERARIVAQLAEKA
ncbi:UDP-4-amino-4,6-dideoxy-N-acetyl-beta-L-altrosamine N-acetyltransferase [Zavarzinia sp. CC-PAN008]|uniref:UDP-4-amino-4, 6-dideoxy-N-acetyl-beta-L-altrosamine N-acetyltransferase n=1 Tax=Zavarzinia sp. CC-PAN008 TaxID=3243332 RepID=UPI003F74847B